MPKKRLTSSDMGGEQNSSFTMRISTSLKNDLNKAVEIEDVPEKRPKQTIGARKTKKVADVSEVFRTLAEPYCKFVFTKRTQPTFAELAKWYLDQEKKAAKKGKAS